MIAIISSASYDEQRAQQVRQYIPSRTVWITA
jgi:hypothetical protein